MYIIYIYITLIVYIDIPPVGIVYYTYIYREIMLYNWYILDYILHILGDIIDTILIPTSLLGYIVTGESLQLKYL